MFKAAAQVADSAALWLQYVKLDRTDSGSFHTNGLESGIFDGDAN